jgi:hypothetical protein
MNNRLDGKAQFNFNPMKTALAAFGLFATLAIASAQTIVTNLADSGPGTLRSAITNAASGAVITFDPSLSGATIALSLTLTVNTNLTIDASALPGGLQINGNGSVQIFNVASNTIVFLNSLIITNGYTTNNGGGINNNGTLTLTNCTLSGNSAYDLFGGGIFNNAGLLTLNQCTLSGNSAIYGLGGGIANSAGTMTLNQCTLFGNSAIYGGGIYNYKGTATLNQCTLSGNNNPGFPGDGGGIYSQAATLTLNQCTLFGNNSADAGGGIYYRGYMLTLNQCTLSENSALYGGGIVGYGPMTLNQCTLSGNSASAFGANAGGGGIFIGGGTLGVTNTIVGGNTAVYGADIYNSYTGTLTYGGSNLVQSVDNAGGTITGPAPLTNAPDLAPLGNYGGPTQTMPPLPGSPALGAGSVADNTFSTDQRGYSRTQSGLIDLGAVELQPAAANPPVLTGPTLGANGAFSFGFNSASNADFTVLATANLALPLAQWSILGEAFQNVPGQFQFTDSAATNSPQKFYRVVSP